MCLLPSSRSDDPNEAGFASAVPVQGEQSFCLRANIGVEFKPRHGAKASHVELRALWFGTEHGPTVIVQGGISAGRDLCSSPAHDEPGWWQALAGPGKAIDTRQCRVLAIDWLDADALGIEAVTSEDQADALVALLDALHVERTAAFVGASYGAMVGLALASRHGDRIQRLVAIAGAHRPHPLASAQRAVQRGILQLGLKTGHETEAVSLARQLALTTYRGSAELAQRFDGPAERTGNSWRLPVEAWLQHGGQKFARQCSARRYLSLSQSIDLHDVDPASIRVPVHLIGIASDRLVPLADLCALQRALPRGASLDVIESACGHDGFLLEHAQLAPLIRESLACAEAPVPSPKSAAQSVLPGFQHLVAGSA